MGEFGGSSSFAIRISPSQTVSSTRDLVILGAGGMGQEVADIIQAAGSDGSRWNLIGFVDDDDALHGLEVLGLPVLGDHHWLSGRRVALAMGVGAPAARRRAWAAAQSVGAVEAPALVHPTAYMGVGVGLGEGTIVGAHATMTADVVIGRFGIVNVGATVSHNARLDDFATVAPGAHLAGGVRVGEGADIGIGASVTQGNTIGAWAIVGAGTVVIRDVAANTTVVGSPARVVDTRPAGWQE
jgi:sugar O-acyltransferase (sialic acid O-acetyltransferase NeuD family)